MIKKPNGDATSQNRTRTNGTATQVETPAGRTNVLSSSTEKLPAIQAEAAQLSNLSNSCSAISSDVLALLIKAAERNGSTLSVIETFTISTEE